MRIHILFLLSIFLLLQSSVVAQTELSSDEPPVRLEYVEAQNLGNPAMGSFVIKNNYASRNLDDHILNWDLSLNGISVKNDSYPLTEIKAGDTKYIKLPKLFDLDLLNELGEGLISIYAEIQDRKEAADPIRLVGESAVLAEAENNTAGQPEQFHIIKVGGARIHRIANGNSLTLDDYNQISALDLGKGNLLAGPIRPVVYFESLSARQPAQRIIDSLGPTRLFVNKDELSGFIEYDIQRYGLLSLPFSLTEAGLTIGIQISEYLTAPVHLALEAPLREVKDSISLIGQEPLSNKAPLFGDTRVGFHKLRIIPKPFEFYPLFRVRSLLVSRGEIRGDSFIGILSSATQSQQSGTGITHHPLAMDTWILEFGRSVELPYGASMKKPISVGEWLFAPVFEKD